MQASSAHDRVFCAADAPSPGASAAARAATNGRHRTVDGFAGFMTTSPHATIALGRMIRATAAEVCSLALPLRPAALQIRNPLCVWAERRHVAERERGQSQRQPALRLGLAAAAGAACGG